MVVVVVAPKEGAALEAPNAGAEEAPAVKTWER